MKQTIDKPRALRDKSWLAAWLAAMALLGGCASDNVHQPEPDLTPKPQRYEGKINSSIPVFPNFPAIIDDNYAVVSWHDQSQTMADIELGPFFVYISVTDLSFDIGTMHIQDVECQRQEDGSWVLSQPEFECQAGAYFTTGSLVGTLADGQLDFTILYHPGSMPFEVRSQFTGI